MLPRPLLHLILVLSADSIPLLLAICLLQALAILVLFFRCHQARPVDGVVLVDAVLIPGPILVLVLVPIPGPILILILVLILVLVLVPGLIAVLVLVHLPSSVPVNLTLRLALGLTLALALCDRR